MSLPIFTNAAQWLLWGVLGISTNATCQLSYSWVTFWRRWRCLVMPDRVGPDVELSRPESMPYCHIPGRTMQQRKLINPLLTALASADHMRTEAFNVDSLPPGGSYERPGQGPGDNSCMCSTVTYSLISACAICQGQIADKWVVAWYCSFRTNIGFCDAAGTTGASIVQHKTRGCKHTFLVIVFAIIWWPARYTPTIPPATAVPDWAYLDGMLLSLLNIPANRKYLAFHSDPGKYIQPECRFCWYRCVISQHLIHLNIMDHGFLDAPESTGPRSLASTSSVISSSSSSKKLKAGAIAGVVIGGKLDCLYRYAGGR